MLISYINKLAEDEMSSLLDAVTLMMKTKEPAAKPSCPYCNFGKVVCDGIHVESSVFSVKTTGALLSRCKYHYGKLPLPATGYIALPTHLTNTLFFHKQIFNSSQKGLASSLLFCQWIVKNMVLV